MSTQIDWLLRPVIEGLCSYESLKRCEIDLLDIAIMNDALDVREENSKRVVSERNRNGK